MVEYCLVIISRFCHFKHKLFDDQKLFQFYILANVACYTFHRNNKQQ
jgi:hypothetical protein